jgi:ATP-binding cassette subfamily B protein
MFPKGEIYQKMKRLYQFLRSSGLSPVLILFGVFLPVFVSFLNLVLPEVLRLSTEAIKNRDLEALIKIGTLGLAAAFLTVFIEAVNSYFRRWAQNYGEEGIQRQILEKTARIKTRSLRKYTSGEIVTETVNNTIEGIQLSFEGICSRAQGLAAILLTSAYMFFLDWRITLLIVGYNAALRLISIRIERQMKKNADRTVAVNKENNAFFVSFLINMTAVRIFERDGFFLKLLHKKERQTLKANFKQNAWNTGVVDATWATAKFAEFVIIYGLGGWLVYRGIISIGILLAFVFASDTFVKGIEAFSSSLVCKNAALANIESIKGFLDIEDTECETGVLKLPSPFIVRFENVSFGYGEENILEGVHFIIEPGDKVLVRGPNGAGKSTLLYLLAGLYRPTGGRILFGGEDIATVNLDELVKTYGLISQRCYILNGNVKENIALKLEYREEAVQDILRLLLLERTVETAPQLLSQGEKQRINIGRALYKDETALVLGDEIFSNVDKESITAIAETLRDRFQDKTVIFVCHEPIDFPFNKIFSVRNKTVFQEAFN